MPRFIDRTGHRYGRWLVLSRAEDVITRKAKIVCWLCRCDCGTERVVRGASLTNGASASCGCAIQQRNQFDGLVPERFWSRVKKGGPSDCWEWTGARFSSRHPHTARYGMFVVGRHPVLAHRASWYLFTGQEPNGCVLHHCDNRLCVNPFHLYIGTFKSNGNDKATAGRSRNGYTGPMTAEEELATRGYRPCTP